MIHEYNERMVTRRRGLQECPRILVELETHRRSSPLVLRRIDNENNTYNCNSGRSVVFGPVKISYRSASSLCSSPRKYSSQQGRQWTHEMCDVLQHQNRLIERSYSTEQTSKTLKRGPYSNNGLCEERACICMNYFPLLPRSLSTHR